MKVRQCQLYNLPLYCSSTSGVRYTQTMVRISPERIKELQKLLKEQTGKDYSDEEAQQDGMAIIRFVLAKEQLRRGLGKQQKPSTPKRS